MASRLTPLTLLLFLLLAGDRASPDPEATSPSPKDPLSSQEESEGIFPEDEAQTQHTKPTVESSTWPTTKITNDTTDELSTQTFTQAPTQL
ncbi:hypothetical protein NL478_26870, partial [Klebsiella pneumoniae]|nr:hypothetical protein [Klebsiella pneumoniae]